MFSADDICYSTSLGSAVCGDSRDLLKNLPEASVQLIVTSPPFALQRKKEYGNESQEDYASWLLEFGNAAFSKLKSDGSFVIDIGGAYQKGKPVRSLYQYEMLLRFCKELGYQLAEEFYWYNPSKLPSPIEWVNKRKIRAKDSVNTVWWFCKNDFPKADISKVLVPYSERMKKLLANPEAFYTPKKRPSGHDISSAFAIDNGGAIPSNLLQIPNTESNSSYQSGCKLTGISAHPARFPEKFVEFFIQYLTDPGDLVIDIFAGSNTTGSVAEKLERRWFAFENERNYIASSAFRFADYFSKQQTYQQVYDDILLGRQVQLHHSVEQLALPSSASAVG